MSLNKNIFQQVLEFSETANLLCEPIKTSKPEELQAIFVQAMQALENRTDPPKWKAVWGPAVTPIAQPTPTTKDNAVAVNTVFVVNGGSIIFDDGNPYDTYVVAVGATFELKNLIEAISDIDSVIDLDHWARSGLDKHPLTHNRNDALPLSDSAYIANGFGQALFRLINSTSLVAPHKSATLLQSVQEAVNDKNAKIVFTGHSFGGALAYSLAYLLAKAGKLGPSPFKRIHVYPTGAPSLGNRTFTKNFSDCFSSPEKKLEGYRHWNVNIVNPFDIVPHAYCTSSTAFTLDKIPSMYHASRSDNQLELVKAAVSGLESKAKDFYAPLKSSTFMSPVPRPPVTPGSYAGFLLCAGQQHISAYKAYILGPEADLQSHEVDVVQ